MCVSRISVVFADFNDFMRHSAINIISYPVSCGRRQVNNLFKPHANPGVLTNCQICHACLHVSVLGLKTTELLQCSTNSQRDNKQPHCPETMQSTSMNTTVSFLRSNDNNDTSTQQQFHKKGSLLIKIMSMNCNSIKGIIKNYEVPHVILGCESSKIDSIFPTHVSAKSLLGHHALVWVVGFIQPLPSQLYGGMSGGPYQTPMEQCFVQ